jgi:hypothetical protein
MTKNTKLRAILEAKRISRLGFDMASDKLDEFETILRETKDQDKRLYLLTLIKTLENELDIKDRSINNQEYGYTPSD